MEKGRMRNKKTDAAGKRLKVLLVCLLTAAVYAGCGAGSGSHSGMKDIAADAMTGADSQETKGAEGGASYDIGASIHEEEAPYEPEPGRMGVLDERKLIKTVRLEAETREFEQMISSLEEQVREMGGYIENMETYNGSRYSDHSSSRYANLTIRIPKGKLDAFLQTVSDISNIVRRYDNVEDVTLSYVDMESRRDTLRIEQSRLLEFLDKAETIEDIIVLEERLSEVRYQLESMESKLRTMDNLIDYSTVQIDISEVRELTVVEEEEPTAWERIAGGFLESLRDIAEGAAEIGIWILVHIPYLAVWAAAIAILVLAWRKCRKMRVRRQEASHREAEARMQAQKLRMQEWENGCRRQEEGPGAQEAGEKEQTEK